jgi:CTP synthase (UTP-ammonia lyase)
MPTLPVGVVLDSASSAPYHLATLAAIDHAAQALSLDVEAHVLRSNTLNDLAAVEAHAALVIGPGSPYDDPEAVLATIRAARERGVPLVGT